MDQYLTRQRGATSNIFRVKIRDTSDNNGAGKTGLTSASSGLIISTIANNEATPTTYTAAGSTVETIGTLGTFAAPTATKIRFKEVDATNHPGLYEIQIADARMAVSGSKSLTISILGVSDAEQTDVQIDLTSTDNMVAADAVGLSGDTVAADHAESYFDGTGYGVHLQGGTLTVTNQTTMVLSAGSADNDAYNGCLLLIQDQTDAFQKSIVAITDYVGASKTVTIPAPKFTVATGDLFIILPPEATTAEIQAALDGAVLDVTGNTFKGRCVLSIP